jgi:hypothetical protein
MSPEQKVIARSLFQLKVFNSDGQAFETLFTVILTLSNPNFIQIKPQGNLGDEKNDGFDRTSGTYYQCYAPEDIEKREGKALSKLKEDFGGLKSKWNHETPIKKFFYVLNDKYKGVYASIVHELAWIKNEHGLEDAAPFLNKDLENVFFGLSDEQIFSVIGMLPKIEMDETVQLSALGEVVDHLIQTMKPKTGSGKLVAPDFNEKIEFNYLSAEVAQILTDGNYQSHALTAYFSSGPSGLKEDLRDIFNKLYVDLGKKYLEVPTKEKSDILFFDIADKSFPNQKAAHQQAIFVLMSYFFESCDIFEEPGAKS